MRLGRKPARRDHRTPSLARYSRALALAPPPPAVDWYSKVANWPMDLNDQLGDCTCAAVSHAIQQWSTYAAAPLVMADSEVLALYEAVSGYNPQNPATDQGAVEMDVLEYWMKNPIAGKPLLGFAAINIASMTELKHAIHWFGNVYIGINCPQSALDDLSLWDLVPGSPVEGGHAVVLVGYDLKYFYTVSWGKLIPVTPAFLGTYLEEAYACLDSHFLSATGTTPLGFNIAQLTADMQTFK